MKRIDEAMRAVSREDFLPAEVKDKAEWDMALRIGYGQTNSQPYTVRLMLGWLEPGPDEKMLDVGSGSGWTTALLAYLVGPSGEVYAVERVPELVTFGADNCLKYGFKNTHFFRAGKKLGLPKHAPYDRVLVSAAARELPQELTAQLKPGGRLVVPIKNSIYVIDKQMDGGYLAQEYPGFIFVPLL